MDVQDGLYSTSFSCAWDTRRPSSTKNDRRKYLRALQRADASDYGALGEFIARAIMDNLYKFIVPAIAGPAR